jgi:hypothetical protein
MLQLILAGAIAVVVAGIVLYVFMKMSRLRKPAGAKAAEAPKSWQAQEAKPNVKVKAPRPPRKPDDISQDYIYGLVMGKMESDSERSLARQEYDYRKKK